MHISSTCYTRFRNIWINVSLSSHASWYFTEIKAQRVTTCHWTCGPFIHKSSAVYKEESLFTQILSNFNSQLDRHLQTVPAFFQCLTYLLPFTLIGEDTN